MQGLMMGYPLTVDRILEHANRMYPRKRVSTRLADGSMHRYTYGDLYRRVKRLAGALVDLGVGPGERVATFAWNNYQHLELYFAVPGSGAVLHPLNIHLLPEQLAYIVNHAEDRVIFVDGPLLSRFEQVADDIDGIEYFVLFNAESGVETKLAGVLMYEDLMSGADEEFEWEVADENTAAALCYTGGTTGGPRGVLYSHRSIYLHTLGENQPNALGLRESDSVLAAVPQYHAMAWGLPFASLFAGADLVLPGAGIDEADLLELISQEKVTVPAAVPSVWGGVLEQLRQSPQDLWHIRQLVAGGEALSRSTIQAFEQEFDTQVLHCWGMTETSPLGTVSRLSAHHAELPNDAKWDLKATQGMAIPGVEIRIVNEKGEKLPWDGSTVGEVQVCGPWIARGYFKEEPDKKHFTADGWFRTGDVASITPDGYMRITDRIKDLVRSGGEWISSAALETALMRHPKVKEAAVIAVPDEKHGERPLAVVVLRPDVGGVTADEFTDHLAPSFPLFWIPDDFVLVDQIPRTAQGRFDKKELRRRFAAGELGA
ncbi:MAG TPA: long-chain fatty acid--CoA ligase [Gemmatimonadota bacterium]|nr:long-chain fatty acid--CoA ligase [Gemmatimonadota bacterium]